MVALLVVMICVAAALVARMVVRRRRRAREAATMFVPTIPAIELEQPYGAWDADPSDAYTGHGMPRPRMTWHDGPPSQWARLPLP